MKTIKLKTPEIAAGGMLTVSVDGSHVLLCRAASGFYAVQPICPHQDKPLEGGRIRGHSLLCPHHGARFDLASGKSQSPQLTTKNLAIFPCIEDGGELSISLP